MTISELKEKSPSDRSLEQRDHYRVFQNEPDLTVFIVRRGRQRVRGELIDISVGGAGIRVGSDAPELSIGTKVRLRFEGSQLDGSVTTPVSVRFKMRDSDNSLRYGFQFARPEHVRQKIPPNLREDFNRRQMFRVRPSKRYPVSLHVRAVPEVVSRATGGKAAEAARAVAIQETAPLMSAPTKGTVTDLSGGGLSALVPLEASKAFRGVTLVQLVITLPKVKHDLLIFGRIVYRLELKKYLRMGIEFDRIRSPNFMKSQRKILAFALQRQREMVKTEGKKKRRQKKE